ncbi:MAG: septum formation initiator family protein [Kiritimatiellae bacterium]|nr:septum formation initiator family protein [Kiritimatiellia bacterium]
MTEGFTERFWKVLTVVLLAVITVGGVFSIWPTYLRGRGLKQQDEELTRRIEEKKREIARLIDYQKRFNTDVDLVERIARQSDRVYPGELVFVFEK